VKLKTLIVLFAVVISMAVTCAADSGDLFFYNNHANKLMQYTNNQISNMSVGSINLSSQNIKKLAMEFDFYIKALPTRENWQFLRLYGTNANGESKLLFNVRHQSSAKFTDGSYKDYFNELIAVNTEYSLKAVFDFANNKTTVTLTNLDTGAVLPAATRDITESFSTVDTISSAADTMQYYIRSIRFYDETFKVKNATGFETLENVQNDKEFAVTFTTPVDGSTLNGITLKDSNGKAVMMEKSLSNDQKTVDVKLPKGLDYDTEYVFEVSQNVKSLAGDTLLEAYTKIFRTEAEPLRITDITYDSNYATSTVKAFNLTDSDKTLNILFAAKDSNDKIIKTTVTPVTITKSTTEVIIDDVAVFDTNPSNAVSIQYFAYTDGRLGIANVGWDRAFSADRTLYNVEIGASDAIPDITMTGYEMVSKATTTADSTDNADNVTIIKNTETEKLYRIVYKSATDTPVLTENDITFETDTKMVISLENVICEKGNILILRPTALGADTSWQYSDFTAKTADIVESVIPVNGETSVSYTFPVGSPSGRYAIYLGSALTLPANVADESAFFSSQGDIDDAMAAIRSLVTRSAVPGADMAAINAEASSTFALNSNILKFDGQAFSSVSGKTFIIKYFQTADLSTPESFRLAYGEALATAKFNESSDRISEVNTYNSVFGIDFTLYNTVVNKTGANGIINGISQCANPSVVKTEFDAAVVTALINESYPADIEKYLEEQYTALMLDATNYTKYTQMSDKSAVWEALKNKNFTSSSLLRTAFDNAVNPPQADPPAGGGGGSGSGSGGSGSGGFVSSGPEETVITVEGGRFEKQNPEIEKIEDVVPKTVIFDDLETSSWAEDAIIALYDKGIVNGVGGKKFKPEASVTREEFLKMLIIALEIDTEDGETSFKDIEPNEWYAKYITTAHSKGIVNGVSNERFGVGENIKRQDMAVMVLNALEAVGKEIDTVRDTIEWSDSAEIADYASEKIGALYASGIINGVSDDSFAPLDTATRAMAAQIIYKLITVLKV